MDGVSKPAHGNLAALVASVKPAPGARTFWRYALHAAVLYGGEQDACNYQEKPTDTHEEPHLDGYELVFTSRRLIPEELASVHDLIAEYPHELDQLRRAANVLAAGEERVTF